jgi:hypothetical protein
LYSNAWL